MNNKKTIKSLKKNALLSILYRLMRTIFPLITFPYASRILMPEGIGRVNFANAIVSYFVLLASLGIGVYATREGAKYRDNIFKFSKFVKEIFLINCLSTTISYLLFFIIIFNIQKLKGYTSLLLLSGTTIFFTSLGLNWVYSALEEFTYATVRSIIFLFASIAFLFIFVKTKNDYLQYMGMTVLASVGANICNIIHSRKFVKWKEPCTLELKKHIKPIFIFFGIEVASNVHTLIDTSMLGFMSDDTQVGFYSAATKCSKIVSNMILAAISILLPRLSYYYENGELKKFLSLSKRAFQFITYVSVPSVAGLFLLSKPLILVLSGNQYLPAVLPMEIISPVVLFVSLSNLMSSQILTPMGKEKFVLLAVIAGSIINASLNMFFIPSYGASGAAIATVISEFLIVIVNFYFSRKIIFSNFSIDFIIQIVLSTFFMFCIVYKIQMEIKSPIKQLLICSFIGAIIYALSTILMKNKIAIELFDIIRGKK